ncbi:hypothetical protein Q5P01_020136 [Channa striata]|uniref:Uncharacterized protein n=1 Tax=Channa striata TaxID=64152 RepID=A0AA88S0W5_CHASR|nr:hypothetical protein Q5P01_020136 [Channa striata]
MGSGTSRGKKVAPACVSEVKVSPSAAGVTSPGQDGNPMTTLKTRALSRQPPDCHSEGHDSDFSWDDEDGEQGRAAADHDRDRESGRKPAAKKSKTYGLCHLSREDAEDDFGSTRLRAAGKAEGPRGSRGASGDVNKRSGDAFTHFPKRASGFQQNSSAQGFLTREASLEAVTAAEKQAFRSSSLTMPVILYDGSEEELMDTIEREFS